MKFVPIVEFSGGQLRPLTKDDIPAIVQLFQKNTITGQSESAIQEQAQRMVDLSVQMAATQRGIIWALEINGEMQGTLSLYDWQPTALKTVMKVDALEQVSSAQQVMAIDAAIELLQQKYHLRNFAYQWTEVDGEAAKAVFIEAGFEQQAIIRDGRRTGQQSFTDVILFNRILLESK